MRNAEVATVLEETADLLAMEEVPFKPGSYRPAANQVSQLPEPARKAWLSPDQVLNTRPLDELQKTLAP